MQTQIGRSISQWPINSLRRPEGHYLSISLVLDQKYTILIYFLISAMPMVSHPGRLVFVLRSVETTINLRLQAATRGFSMHAYTVTHLKFKRLAS